MGPNGTRSLPIRHLPAYGFKISPHFSAAIGYNYFATQDTSYDYGGFTVGFKGVQVNTAMIMLQWSF